MTELDRQQGVKSGVVFGRVQRMLPALIIGLWVLWVLGVIAHGYGADLWPGDQPNFAVSGAFGDSFGPLASLMAALAATGAFLTLQQQRDSLDEQAKSSRQQIDRLSRQAFEQTFFQLLNLLHYKTDQIDVPKTVKVGSGHVQEMKRGPDAFALFAYHITEEVKEFDADQQIGNYYRDEFQAREADLGHYFRLLYHVILVVDQDQSLPDFDVKYFYIRILRAQLSHPKLLMILMNCLFGHGHEKFLPLAHRYDLFQNLCESEDEFNKRLCRFYESVTNLNVSETEF